MCLSEETGPRIKAGSLYEKGQLYCQTEAVNAHVGKRNGHIRKVEHSVGKILSEMTGFTREWWSTRSSISTLFNELPKPKATNLSTYMLTGGELIGKIVRKSLPFDNGGIFRPEELQYLNKVYETVKGDLMQLHKLCKNPSEEFAENFWDYVDQLATTSKMIEKDLGSLYAARAKVLFRGNSKKKADVKWNQLTLDEKISSLAIDESRRLFTPTNLPKFAKVINPVKASDFGDIVEFSIAKYAIKRTDDLYQEQLLVATSYENMVSFLLEDAE